MRRVVALLLVLAAVGGVGTGAGATDRDTEDTCGSAPPAGFHDVDGGNVHSRRIDCIKHFGITTGVTPETYDPAGLLIRGQLATFLARTLEAGGHPVPEATLDWFDDDNGSVHEPAINRLAEAGIVSTGSRTFGIGVTPSRAEMAALTAASLQWAHLNDGGLPADWFVDDDGLPEELAIDRLAQGGIITGKAPGVFAPADLLRRDQMATFLARSVDALQNGLGHHHHCRIAEPQRPRFDPFYSQECQVFGISVVGSSNVDPAALAATVDVLLGMLGARPDIHSRMASDGFYLILLGEEEGQTAPPEYADLRDDPNTNWDERARGLGGYEYASAGEENVLCRETDRYRGESILIHEFAHSILDAGLETTRPGFTADVQSAYDQAMAAGLWQGTYAAENFHEYWAEGVQSWFDANLEADPPDGIHNHVNTHEELYSYDQGLYNLIDSGLGSTWRYACP